MPKKEPALPSRRVPSLFVQEGDQRTAIVAPDEPVRDPQEVLRAREKRRRQQEAERLKGEADVMDSVRRIRNIVVLFVVVAAISWGAWWVHQKWQGQWPIFFTWTVMAVVMLVGFGWALWYTGED